MNIQNIYQEIAHRNVEREKQSAPKDRPKERKRQQYFHFRQLPPFHRAGRASGGACDIGGEQQVPCCYMCYWGVGHALVVLPNPLCYYAQILVHFKMEQMFVNVTQGGVTFNRVYLYFWGFSPRSVILVFIYCFYMSGVRNDVLIHQYMHIRRVGAEIENATNLCGRGQYTLISYLYF